jgi:beta-lactamase superfamily II metal-dependent hydrolase
MSKLLPGNKTFATVTLILILLVLLLSPPAYGQLSDSLRVSYIDVGQGDSIWLHASDETDILIDGGPRSAGPGVVAYLQNEGIDDIEVMVLTHAHADHVGGLIDVLRSTIPVESVIYNGQHYTSLTYQQFLTETQRLGLTPIPVHASQTYTWGPLDASVLNPQAPPTGDQNEDSVVMLIVYGDMRFLFTGDIGKGTEQTILNSGTLRAWAEARILKVAHHGGKYSSSAAFLEAVGAELAVISVGAASNPYGYPAQETLDSLRAAGARVLRTDQNGTIVVTTDGQTYEFEANFVVFLPLVVKPSIENKLRGHLR